MKKKSEKLLALCGIMLFISAAFFALSLLLGIAGVGASSKNLILSMHRIGIMLVCVYGFCSILIPVFLLLSSFCCFYAKWKLRTGFVQFTSFFPFFTAVMTERVCKILHKLEDNPLGYIKIGFLLVLGALVIAIEFLALSIIGEMIERKVVAKKAAANVKKNGATEEKVSPVCAETKNAHDEKSCESELEPAATEFDIQKTTIFDDALDAIERSAMAASLDMNIEEYDDKDAAASIKESSLPAEVCQKDSCTPESDVCSIIDYGINYGEYEQGLKVHDGKNESEVSKTSKDTDIAYEVDSSGMDSSAKEVPHEQTIAEEQDLDGALDPEFFDIDMNAEDEEELQAEQESRMSFAGVADVFADMDDDALMQAEASCSDDGTPLYDSVLASETKEDSVLPPVDNDTEDVPIQQCEEGVADSSDSESSVTETLSAFPIKDDIDKPQQCGYNEQVSSEQEQMPKSAVPQEAAEAKQIEAPVLCGIRVPPASEQDAPLPLIIKPPVSNKKYALNRPVYEVPVNLLTMYEDNPYWIIDDETKNSAAQLKETLSEFKIAADIVGIRKGPVITMFELLPAPGVKLSKIVALQDNIALRLAASSVRIVAPIPGKRAVGIEVPNKERAIVSFREIISQDVPSFKKMSVPVILGKDIQGGPQIIDLVRTPHLLIAGATGAGKSVCVNSMILSILYKRSPQDVKLILIDPKIVELKLYNDIPHLLAPVITQPKRAIQALQYCLCEMERRYALLDGMGVRDISSYNQRIVERHIAAEKLPYIIVIIDEFADLMATTGKEMESTVARLAAMSRAIGIHIVLATQRPSIDVITGLIKANIPSRIAFMVSSKIDSRIIVDQVGAEKLLGRGDMLYASSTDPFPIRIQGTFISDDDVENVVDYVKTLGEPDYIEDEMFIDDEDEEDEQSNVFDDGDDPLYEKALDIVVQAGKASASYIQRRLKIGYNRAARLVEEMESRGIVGPANGSKAREIIHMP